MQLKINCIFKPDMAKIQSKQLQEKRCNGCNKVLAKANITSGTLEIVCPNSKCKTVNTWTAGPNNKESESLEFSIRSVRS